MALQTGELLNNRFEIKRQVGHGGFSIVYLAYDRRLRDHVALKVFDPESVARFGDAQTMRKRFVQEARVARKLLHPHIIPIYDLDPSEELSFIVMPYLPDTLDDRLEQLTIQQAALIMRQILEGVACAHSQGVVHCDLKPNNILFDKEGQVKITDFGIAHVPHEADTTDHPVTSGFHVGTALYMSPEQLDGKRDDPRIDVYALGALFYQMLTGGQYYLDFDSSGTIQAQVSNIWHISTKEPKRDPVRQAPPPLVDIIFKALSKKPEDRYANAGEMLHALKNATSSAKDTVQFQPEEPAAKHVVTEEPPAEPPVSEESLAKPLASEGRLTNPYYSEQPVTDPAMFFGRQEILAAVLGGIHANNFAIYGPKRIGKTSLLHQIDYQLSETRDAQLDYLPIFVSLHGASEASFFRDLMRKLVVGLRNKRRYPAKGVALQCDSGQVNTGYDVTTFVDDLAVLRDALQSHSSSRDVRLVLLIDEGDVLNTFDQMTLAGLRSIFMQCSYLKMVLSREERDTRKWKLSGSSWESVLGAAYPLTPFTREDALSLVEKPVQGRYHYQPEAVEFILKRSQLVPRHIQNICRQVVEEASKDPQANAEITLRHVQAALAQVPNLPGKPIAAPNASKSLAFAIVLGVCAISLVATLIWGPRLVGSWPWSATKTAAPLTLTETLRITDTPTPTRTRTFTPTPTHTVTSSSTATSTSTLTPTLLPRRTPTPTPTCSGGRVWNGSECVCPPDKPNWLGGQCIPGGGGGPGPEPTRD